MPKNPTIAIDSIQDQYVRKNFEALDQYFSGQNQLLDFKFFELVFTQAVTGFKKAHGLSYTPLDILVTRISGTGAVIFKYDQFDSSNLVMDVTGACRIRFFVGTYSGFQTSVQTGPGDAQKVTSGV